MVARDTGGGGGEEVAGGVDGKMKVGRPNHFLLQCPPAMGVPDLPIRILPPLLFQLSSLGSKLEHQSL